MADDPERLLGYALPVVRFLQVRSLRVRFTRFGVEDDTTTGPWFEPPASRPSPEGLHELLVEVAGRLVENNPETAGAFGSIWVNARDGTWSLEIEDSAREIQWRPLAVEEKPYAPAPGLSSFLKGVWSAPHGHLIFADWLEDHFGPSPLACALRASESEPKRRSRDRLSYDAFRWRWLDRDVMCYFSRGSHRSLTKGVVLGLLQAKEGEIPRQWARWLRVGADARNLAADVGVTWPDPDDRIEL